MVNSNNHRVNKVSNDEVNIQKDVDNQWFCNGKLSYVHGVFSTSTYVGLQFPKCAKWSIPFCSGLQEES